MKKDTQVHFDFLVEFIAELDTNNVLNDATIQKMAASLDYFCSQAILKFIKGQIEHGGNITDRDLNKEIFNETIDLFWYNEASYWIKQKKLTGKD